MKRRAIILAGSASLARVAGLSLVKRMLLTLARAGVGEAQVVSVGAGGSSDRPSGRLSARLIEDDGEVSRAGLRATLLESDGEVAGLRAAARRLVETADSGADAQILVVRADRVLDVGLVKRTLQSEGSVAVTDHAAPGKVIGAWTAPASALAGISDSTSTTTTIDDALTALTATTLDSGDNLWAIADSPATRRLAERALFQSMRKPIDGPVSRHINRPVSLTVTRLLIKTGVTPNQMTVVATIFGVVGVWFVLRATWATVAIGSTLVQLQSVLDGCDGEIARLKFKSSRFGEWLDNVLDDLINASYGLALGYASAEMFDQKLFQWLGVGAAGAIMVYNLVVYVQLALRHGTGNPAAFRWWFQKNDNDLTREFVGAGLVTRGLKLFHSLSRRDVFLFVFMWLAIARLPHVATVWYAVLCTIYLCMIVIHLLNGGMPTLPARDVTGSMKAKAGAP